MEISADQIKDLIEEALKPIREQLEKGMMMVKDISKISLKDDEILLVSFPDDITQDELSTISRHMEKHFPKEFMGKIHGFREGIKFTKVCKDEAVESDK